MAVLMITFKVRAFAFILQSRRKQVSIVAKGVECRCKVFPEGPGILGSCQQLGTWTHTGAEIRGPKHRSGL